MAKAAVTGTLAELREWQRKIDALPPIPRCIIARRDVPYGGAFRMWDTRGEFVVYANRGQIADMPRAEKDPNPFSAAPIAAFSIPVMVE